MDEILEEKCALKIFKIFYRKSVCICLIKCDNLVWSLLQLNNYDINSMRGTEKTNF